jgi:hypothetical protein
MSHPQTKRGLVDLYQERAREHLSWIGAISIGIAVLACIALMQVVLLYRIHLSVSAGVYEVLFEDNGSKVELRIAGFTVEDHFNCQVLVASNLEGQEVLPEVNFQEIPSCIPGELHDRTRARFATLVVALLLIGFLSVGLFGTLLYRAYKH